MTAVTDTPIVFGATYSVYVRIVRLTLVEKGVTHRLEDVDIFAPGGPSTAYLKRHPFGRIPAFEHGDLRLHETTAICRYADEAFEGPRLTPADVSQRALMAQTIGMLDSYAYRALVWDIYLETVAKPAEGGVTDPAIVERGMKTAATVVDILDSQCRASGFLAGDVLSLADLHAWPMIDYFLRSNEGANLIDSHGNLKIWAGLMASRSAAQATAFPDTG